MKVGDPIWFHDADHRVYRKDANGRSVGGPIYREQWREGVVKGETRASWLLPGPYGATVKVPKGRPLPHRYALSKEEVDDRVWDAENRHLITARINYGMHGVAHVTSHQLRKVAEIIGYVAPTN